MFVCVCDRHNERKTYGIEYPLEHVPVGLRSSRECKGRKANAPETNKSQSSFLASLAIVRSNQGNDLYLIGARSVRSSVKEIRHNQFSAFRVEVAKYIFTIDIYK